jgi:hypothetical protein
MANTGIAHALKQPTTACYIFSGSLFAYYPTIQRFKTYVTSQLNNQLNNLTR